MKSPIPVSADPPNRTGRAPTHCIGPVTDKYLGLGGSWHLRPVGGRAVLRV
ncbi:hypothetical protein ACFQ7N_37325 [Streptomyces niveus]|uniref:hypothetical protein n=1 Tax=Streptomyces niveus TaxID=193462 RepID=UPI00367E1E58